MARRFLMVAITLLTVALLFPARGDADTTTVFRVDGVSQQLFESWAVGESAGVTVIPEVGDDTAHLWISTSGGPCVRASIPAVYNSSNACDTVMEARAAATGGDTIRMVSGEYNVSEFTVTSGGSKSPAVMVKTETDGTVGVSGTTATLDFRNIQGLIIDGREGAGGYGFDLHNIVFLTSAVVSIGWNSNPVVSNFEMRGFKIRDNTASGTVTVSNASGAGAMLHVTSCEDITISDFTIYNIGRADGIQSGGGPGATPVPGTSLGRCDGLTFDRMVMHTAIGVAPDDHQDGMQFFCGSNITIRNSIIYGFTNAGSQEIFSNTGFDFPCDSSPTTDVNLTLENNIIRHDSGGGAGLNMGVQGGITRLVNNTIEVLNTCTGADDDCDVNTIVAHGNLFTNGCDAVLTNYHEFSSGGSWGDNVVGGNCGWGDENYTSAGTWDSLFVNTSTPDFHLATGSFAIDKGSATVFTSEDYEGDSRPCGSAVDAGADEDC